MLGLFIRRKFKSIRSEVFGNNWERTETLRVALAYWVARQITPARWRLARISSIGMAYSCGSAGIKKVAPPVGKRKTHVIYRYVACASRS